MLPSQPDIGKSMYMCTETQSPDTILDLSVTLSKLSDNGLSMM